jgi:MerR family transcriptional regulator, heat shock protein HspR
MSRDAGKDQAHVSSAGFDQDEDGIQEDRLIGQKPSGTEVDKANTQRTLSSAGKSGGREGKKGANKGGGLGQITADRPIFTLSVAADLLGLHPRTLRIYEEKKLVVPARTGGNRRRYSQNDIRRFSAIRRLTQGGVNLEGVRIILEMSEELRRLGGDPTAIIEQNLVPQEKGQQTLLDDER